jgi:DNA-binding NarL/FixJ family response regulator
VNRTEIKSRLSEMDIVWLKFLVQGYTTKQIATEVNQSECAIDQDIYRMILKFGAKNRTQMIALAVKHKIVNP